MLLAGKQYCDNLNEIHAHLTNTARAIELEDFQEEKFVKVRVYIIVIIVVFMTTEICSF